MASWLENAVTNLKSEEGTKLSDELDEYGNPYHLTYNDSEGFLTFGYGHKVTPEDPEYGLGEGQLVSEERAGQHFVKDVPLAVQEARKRIPNFEYLPDDQKSVAMQMAFQMGGNGLGGFTNFLTELNSPAPRVDELRRHMLDSKWAKTQTPARAIRLANSLRKEEEPSVKGDFFSSAEELADQDLAKQSDLAQFGAQQLKRYAPSSSLSEVEWYLSPERQAANAAFANASFPDVSHLSAESEYLYSTKVAEILGNQPGFANLTTDDFLPGKFGVDRTLSPEENYQKNILPKVGSFAFTYNPEGQDENYISSLLDGPTPGLIYLPGPFGGVESADIKNYGDLGPAVKAYQKEREAIYNADGESFTDGLRSYLDASVYAVANATNHTMKFSDYWASALPLAIINGWDYMTTSDEEALEELNKKNPGLDTYLERERKKLKPGATQLQRAEATEKGMRAYQDFIGSDENQAKLSSVYQKLADAWNIPFNKVPALLAQMSVDKSDFTDRAMASAQVRLAAIEDEDYWSKPYYIVPSKLSIAEKRPSDVFSIPTTRAEAGLDVSIAMVTGGLSKVGVTIPSLLFNNYLGRKGARAVRVFGIHNTKRIQLESVKEQLAALGATHTIASRARNYISKKIAPAKSKLGKVDPETGDVAEEFIGPLTYTDSRIKELTEEAARLTANLDKADNYIMGITGRSSVPSVAKAAKKGDKAFYPNAPFWMRLTDEVAFTTAANSMLNNFVFDSSTGLKLADEQDLAEATPLGRFLMAMLPLVGGVAVGSFKSMDSFNPTVTRAEKINARISDEKLATGERHKVFAVPKKLGSEEEKILQELGIENPFRELNEAEGVEHLATAKALLFDRLVYPMREFNPNDYKWGWENLRSMLLDPERRKNIAATIKSGEEYGVDKDFLTWFENGIDDVYKLWDESLSKNEGLKAKKFLEEELNELDYGWLKREHEDLLRIKDEGADVDMSRGRTLDDSSSYVLHRDGPYVAVARARQDGNWDVEILKTDKPLRGKARTNVEKLYQYASDNIEKLFTKEKLFAPAARIRAVNALSDQVEASLVLHSSGADNLEVLQAAFRGIKEKNFKAIASKHEEDNLLKKSNKHLAQYFARKVEDFSFLNSLFRTDAEQEILGQYFRTRLELANNPYFQANTANFSEKAVDELRKVLMRSSQRMANVSAAPFFKESKLSDGTYELMDRITNVDPLNLVSVRKGKPVKVDPVTYFREQVKKNKRKYKAAPHTKHERVILGEVVNNSDPTRPTVTRNSPEQKRIVDQSNGELYPVELNSPDLPDQLYVTSLDGSGMSTGSIVLGGGQKFKVVLTSAEDAALAVTDLRSLVTIAKAANAKEAIKAFKEMLELQKAFNTVSPGAIQRVYENSFYETLTNAKSVEEVFDLYKNNWVGSPEKSLRQQLGGPRSTFTEQALRDMRLESLKKLDVKKINAYGVDKRSIKKNTLLLGKKGTNQVRVYSGVARSNEPVAHLVFKNLAGAGYPLGKQIASDLNLRLQHKKYLEDLKLRAEIDPIEGQWMNQLKVNMPTSVKEAVAQARHGSSAARQAGKPDSEYPDKPEQLIVRGSGINEPTPAAIAEVEADDLFAMNVTDALTTRVGWKFLQNLIKDESAKTAVDTVARLKELGKGKSLAQRGLLEAAARLESAHRMIGVEGSFSNVNFEKGVGQTGKDQILHYVPGSDYTRKTEKTRKTANVFFKAWGRNDRIKARSSRIREDFTNPEDFKELQRLRDERVSVVSRVMPWATQGLEHIRYEFDRMASYNGTKVFLGTKENQFRDALMSKIERFATLTPEEQSAKIWMSKNPEDYVTVKDIKLLLDVVDQNILAPRRYRYERLNKHFQDAWLQNYYPRIWDIKASVDKWKKEGRTLDDGSLPPGMQPLDPDEAIFSTTYKNFLVEKYLRENDKDAPLPKGNRDWLKARSAIEWKLKGEAIYRKDYFDELLDRGFVPATWNPVEMATLKANEMDNYVMGVRITNELIKNNLVHALNYDQLLDITKSYRTLAREKFSQGSKSDNQFDLNFVNVTSNMQQIAPGLFNSRTRAANLAAENAIKDQKVLKEVYDQMTPQGQPLPVQNVWIDPLKDKKTGKVEVEGFWTTVDPKGEIDLSTVPAEIIGNRAAFNKMTKTVPAKMFFADPNVAKLIQNITSPGLAQKPYAQVGFGGTKFNGAAMWDKWRRSNNFLNGVNLGWSAFHASSVGLFENIMNDLTKLSRAVTMVSDLKRAERITNFPSKDGIDKEIDKQWFVKNAAIRALTPGMSLLIQAGQFPVRSRIPTLAMPNVRTGVSTPTELLPSNIPNYKSKTGLNLRKRYEDNFTQRLGDSEEIVGKGFVQVLDEFASKLKGREWEPFQDTFVPQLLKKDHPDYAKYNVGSFGRQIESLVEGTTPSDLINPLFDDIINAGINANFLNPLAARAGQKEWFYSFNKSYIDAVEYVKGEAPIQNYPEGGPATAKAFAARGSTALSMPLRYLGAAASEGQKWLFDSIIPRAKYSAFLENMYQEVYRRPELAKNSFLLQNAAADIAASIDNRFGMLNYDNLMMDKHVKDLMFLYWRAPAWKLGTKREILGGIRDTFYSGSLKAQNKLERLAGVPKEQRRKNVAEIKLDEEDRLELSQRASYLLGMFGLGAYASFFQYARTGEFPSFDEWNSDQSAYNNFHNMATKLWFPLSGDVELGPYGMEPVRLSMPTYNKDILNWFRNYGMGFAETFSHALPPMWGPIKLLWTGQDYQKNSIYDPSSDTIPEKAADFAIAAVKGQTPFGLQQIYDRLVIDEAPLTKVAVEAFLGLTKAGGNFVRSDAFNASMDLMIADLPESSKPSYLSVYQHAQRKVVARINNGENLDRRFIARLFEKDLKDAGLVSNPDILQSLVNRTDATKLSLLNPVAASRGMFENMLRKAKGYDQIHNVVKLMSPEEFTGYFGETKSSRNLRKIQIASRGFQGNQGYVANSLETLSQLIDRKGEINTVPGLLNLHKGTVEDVRNADISDRWKLALIASMRARDGN